MSASVPTLSGESVTLRTVVAADRDSYLAHAGGVETIWGFGGGKADAGKKTPEQADRWLGGRPGWMRWAITVDNRHIGTISLHDISEPNQRATLAMGIMRAEDMNKGYGTQAIKLLLAHAFGTMNLHRVDLRVLARNKRAIRAYEKCGFVREGVERDSAFIDGSWYDDVIMSILNHEFSS
ncbi:MAG: GNAT family protein [Chloroflexi bacterium]|nr:GNAT family protein [Chloroflexota bacterium]